MSKYRIRLESGRVIGPLEKEQIPEFVAKGHIVGSEDCQIFPTGDWKSIREFEEIADILNDSSKQDLAKDSTVIQKLKLAKNQVTGDAEDSEIDFPKKFEFEKKTPFSNRNIPSEEEVEDATEEAPAEKAKAKA